MILAIDTTAEFGSLALCEEDRVIEEVAIHSPDGFAHVIFGELQGLLARHRLRVTDMDRIASASGPGSFTGVRVGLTLAKGLAFAMGKKVVTVSVLQAVASYGTGALRAVVMEARRGEVYAAVYDAGLQLIVPETVTTLDRFFSTLPSELVEFVVMDLEHAGGRQPVVVAPRELAGAIGRIAANREGEAPEAIDANYVRHSDAELFWKDR